MYFLCFYYTGEVCEIPRITALIRKFNYYKIAFLGIYRQVGTEIEYNIIRSYTDCR